MEVIFWPKMSEILLKIFLVSSRNFLFTPLFPPVLALGRCLLLAILIFLAKNKSLDLLRWPASIVSWILLQRFDCIGGFVQQSHRADCIVGSHFVNLHRGIALCGLHNRIASCCNIFIVGSLQIPLSFRPCVFFTWRCEKVSWQPLSAREFIQRTLVIPDK